MFIPGFVPPVNGFVALTYGSATTQSDWRERLVWPIDIAALRRTGEQACREAVIAIAELEDSDLRQAAIASLGWLINLYMVILEKALLADRLLRDNLPLADTLPDWAHLTTDAAPVPSPGPAHSLTMPRYLWLRGIARAATWTPAWRLPLAVLWPQAVAISHNALLRAAAMTRGERIAYRYAGGILNEARQQPASPEPPHAWIEAVAKRLIALVPELGSTTAARAERLLAARYTPFLLQAMADAAGLKRVKLPGRILTGTMGAYPSRAVAAEVRRRGGEVHGFDHGGVSGISQNVALTATIELLLSTRFHVGTPAWAETLRRSGALEVAAPLNKPEIAGLAGEPMFRASFRDAPAGPIRRVIYVGHPYRGLRQFAISALADSIYWDFQMRVVEAVKSLGLDLLCKPHPEGAFRGSRNPVEDLAPTSYRRFEEHLDDADAFLFDAPTSTTFLEALCTRKPVILIDRGHYPINPTIAPRIAERCRIVPASYDARGRLIPDRNALSAALRSDAQVDPSYFRQLAAGTV